jgi:hypothetical protein
MKLDKEKIIESLPIGKCIHKTRNENNFLIIEHRNEKIFFSIPNNKDIQKPFKKSISYQLIIQVFESTQNDFKTFPYKDCRKSATRGIINILNTK